MSFSGSRKFRVDRSTLNSFRDQHNHITFKGIPNMGSVSTARRQDGLSTIGIGDIIPEIEILSAPGYRMHSARYRGRVVVVKVFHGCNSKKELASTVALNKRLMHPALLHMIGTSFPDADVDFIVFDADCDQPVESVLASSLTVDLTRSVSLGLKMIGSLSSGLQYLIDCDVPVTTIGIDNFDIIFGRNEKILISINPSFLGEHFIQYSRPMWMLNNEDGFNLLNDLCQKTFTAINRILYREQLDRECESNTSLQAHHSNTLPTSLQSFQAADITKSIESTAYSASQTPRREYVWRYASKDSSSLKDITSQFRGYLNIPTSPRFPIQQLRQLRARSLPQTHHRCKGYSREEITLTTDIARSAIFSHATPTPQEICTICGEVVSGDEIFLCVCGRDDDYIQPNIKCSVCSIWQHYACVVIPPLGEQSFVCRSCSVTEPLPISALRPTPPALPLPPSLLDALVRSVFFNHLHLEGPLDLPMENARGAPQTIGEYPSDFSERHDPCPPETYPQYWSDYSAYQQPPEVIQTQYDNADPPMSLNTRPTEQSSSVEEYLAAFDTCYRPPEAHPQYQSGYSAYQQLSEVLQTQYSTATTQADPPMIRDTRPTERFVSVAEHLATLTSGPNPPTIRWSTAETPVEDRHRYSAPYHTPLPYPANQTIQQPQINALQNGDFIPAPDLRNDDTTYVDSGTANGIPNDSFADFPIAHDLSLPNDAGSSKTVGTAFIRPTHRPRPLN